MRDIPQVVDGVTESKRAMKKEENRATKMSQQ
jgi:hypothetical protein